MFNVRSKYCLTLLSTVLLASSLSAGEDRCCNKEPQSCVKKEPPPCIKKEPKNCPKKNPCIKRQRRNCNRLYIGGFGGELFSNSASISQMGTALFSEVTDGGPLAVEARGHLKKHSPGFGGAQIGYEWSRCLKECRSWTLAPGAEIEGYWFSSHLKGHLFNQTDTDRLPEHDFLDTFHMRAGVYLANFTLALNNTWKLAPYIGLGVGAARLSLHQAKSLQLAPPEAGINHFNSSRNDASWTFAAQVKVGLRYKIGRFHIFGEYRYLFEDFTNYIFGSTVYPTHAHTTPWNVKIDSIKYNAFAFGVQFDLY